MSALHDALGLMVPDGDGFTLTFERRYAQPLEKVWAAITVPERIAEWLAEARVDLRIGGVFALNFTGDNYAFEGVITELDPPRLIAWTWPHEQHPNSIVRWELFPDRAGCRLILTQSDMHPPHLVEVGAGWHTLLEVLPGAAGGPVVVWRHERELELRPRYAALLTG